MRRTFLRLKSYSSWARYTVAVLCALMAALATVRLFPVLYPNIFPLFFVAVIVSALFGGFKPGALTTALSVGIILYLTPSGWAATASAFIRLGTFVLVSLLVSWLIGAFYRSLAAVRERDARFQEIFEGSREAIFLVGADASFIEVNRAACDLTGYTREELLSMRIPDLHDEENLQPFHHYFDSIMGGQDVVSEAFIQRKDGTQVPVEFSNRRMMFCGRPIMHTTAREITKRKQAEEALAQSETRLRAIVEAEPECVKLIGINGELLEMNPAGLAMIEAETLEQVRNTKVAEIVAPEYRAEFNALSEKVFRGGSGTLEFEIIGLKGTRRWLETHAVPLRDQRGEVIALLGVTRDITEHKRAEEELRRSEERYRDLVENAHDIIYSHDLAGNYTSVNKAGERITGYTREESLRMNLAQTVAPEYLEKVHQMLERKLTGEKVTAYDLEIIAKDGRRIAVEVNTRIILEDGVPVGVQGIARDITERKRAEELLQESERQLAAAQQLAHLGSWEWDIAANRVSWSEELYRIFGLKPQEFGSTYEAYLELVHPYDKEFVQDVIANALRDHQPFDYYPRIVRPDGTVRTIHAVNEVIVDENGTVTKLIGTAQDVTERKDAEKAREQLLKDRKQLLSKLVKVQEDERRRIARELHDQLGQQITALMLGIKWLKDSGQCQPPATKHLNRLQEYADQLGREVHHIAWELRPTALDDLGLQTALGNYLEKWSESSGKTAELHSNGFNGHRLSTQIETTLYRVIQEALTNVLKHSEAEFVSLILERRNNHILAIIEDDGRGFNVEAVMNASESEHKLGLLGMRERLALVFGTLDIESTPGAGTSVFVRIPTPQIESESVIQ